ncbi:Uncharacterised protein [uncultured archaeon]|nr:Uncharacterised protein [uncultured archaeon]
MRIGLTTALVIPLILLLVPAAFADVGPKPYMSFSLHYNMSDNISLISGDQYGCDDARCANATPLMKVGPQRFSCSDDTSCRSVAYGYSDYQKLVINFSDKTRESNVFPAYDGESYYVVVNDDGMEVMLGYDYVVPPAVGLISGLYAVFIAMIATAMTLAIELVVSFAYLFITKKPMLILPWVALINLVSVPLLWAVVLLSGNGISLLIMEAAVFVAEGYAIHLVNKKEMPIKDALTLSLLMNLASFAIGFLLPF